MTNFKKILVNKYERETDTALTRIAQKHRVRVFPKVRVADVLKIENSGLSKDQFSYALKAHFDFVFADIEHNPLFAIEFDEAHHFSDQTTIRRDKLKNSICDQFGFPLLRIDEAYLDRIGDFATVLDWVIEMRFTQEAFYKAQESGEIAYDEVFVPAAMFEWGYYEGEKFIPVNPVNTTVKDLEKLLLEQGKVLTWRPYDPFSRYPGYINRLAVIENLFSLPDNEFSRDFASSYQSAMTYVELPSGRYIFGEARCHVNIDFLEGVNLAYEFASVDLARKITQYRKGVDTSCSLTELEAMKAAVRSSIP